MALIRGTSGTTYQVVDDGAGGQVVDDIGSSTKGSKSWNVSTPLPRTTRNLPDPGWSGVVSSSPRKWYNTFPESRVKSPTHGPVPISEAVQGDYSSAWDSTRDRFRNFRPHYAPRWTRDKSQKAVSRQQGQSRKRDSTLPSNVSIAGGAPLVTGGRGYRGPISLAASPNETAAQVTQRRNENRARWSPYFEPSGELNEQGRRREQARNAPQSSQSGGNFWNDVARAAFNRYAPGPVSGAIYAAEQIGPYMSGYRMRPRVDPRQPMRNTIPFVGAADPLPREGRSWDSVETPSRQNRRGRGNLPSGYTRSRGGNRGTATAESRRGRRNTERESLPRIPRRRPRIR
jgi:hypothetical protein